MIHASRITLKDRILDALIPARRRAREAKTREALRYLVEHPEEPCTIAGVAYIPRGYANPAAWGDLLGWSDPSQDWEKQHLASMWDCQRAAFGPPSLQDQVRGL